MQSTTGQYGTQAGEPAQPVQHSVITASSLGFFFRGVVIPSDLGSLLITVAVMLELWHTGVRFASPFVFVVRRVNRCAFQKSFWKRYKSARPSKRWPW